MDNQPEHAHLRDDRLPASDGFGEAAEERWDDGAIDVPEDDNVFREQLELTPQERAMLEQYSGENRGLRNLDAALRDAVQMVQVSDQRITYLRKMHALLLLRKLKGALQTYDDEEEEEDEMRRSEVHSRGGRDLLPEDYPEFSSEEDEDGLSRSEAQRSARKQKRYVARRGPNSDDFIPVKGGSDFGGHSRGGSLGGKEESVFDPEEALLAKDEEEEAAVYTARPFYTDSGALAPGSFDSDLEKVDADSGSASGTPLEGSMVEKPEGNHKETKAEKAERRAREAAAYDPKRFARRFKRRRRLNWIGTIVFIAYILAFLGYMFIRITKTLALGTYFVYGLFVLGVEILGATTTLIYGTNLIWRPVNPELDRLKVKARGRKEGRNFHLFRGRKGNDAQLPVSDSASVKSALEGDMSVAGDLEEGGVGKDPDVEDQAPPVGQYHIRVLIPCYKEPEDIVRQTVVAIRTAVLPPGCHRTIYVCDDGKDKYKRRMCQRMGREVQYISGRTRPAGETNGKSGNLNNACRQIYPAGCKIPDHEVICVMDADQIADPTFFMKMIPMMDGGDDVGMVLSPQCFHNLNAEADIFNHSNIHFWEYMQPGYDALGFISCTGTNFLIRSKAFQECGWSPEYTLTEDFGLGMELKMRHWQCRYVPEYLAVGEAPDQVRNCFQQRSRWCKGHFQVVFSRQHCPFLQRRLSLFMKILFCSGVWSYLVASIATPTFILVPLLTIWFGIFPIILNWWAALGLTVYYIATTAVLNYARERKHFMPLWFSNVSTVIMFWTYIKALWRATIGKYFSGGIKFKTTLKGLGRLQDSAFGDLIVPIIVLLLCLVSLGIGIGKVANNASGVKTTLLVSLAWMIFNMIPPYLLMHYQFVGRGTTLKIVCKLCFYLSFLVGIAALVLIWLLYPKDFDYPTAIQDNLTYFQSTMVGTVPGNGYGVDWRATAYAQDAKSPIVAPLTAVQGVAHDSSGGWMTGGAGGNIKMTQPIAFTTAMLAWGLLQFPKGFGGSKNGVLQQIRVGAEFLRKSLVEYKANNPDFYVIYQVGNLSTESRYWGYPEANTNVRPSYYVPTTIGTSDLTGSMSAAFAAASLAFQNVDKAYSQGLVNLAGNLYASAKAYPGSYSVRIRGSVCTTQYERASIGPTGAIAANTGVCKGPYDALNGSALAWYNSTSYYDDMTWAATWMYQATRQPRYLNDAIQYYVQHSQGPEQVYDDQLLFNWQNTFWGANLKLAQLQGAPAYHKQAQYFLKYWICATGGDPIKFTPLGRAWNVNDGSLGTTANAAFLSAVYAQTVQSNSTSKAQRYNCFAKGQTRYVLGDSGSVYQVGYGSGGAGYAQVMGASCPGLPVQGKAQNCTAAQLISRKKNPHTATGALLEQSSFSDQLSVVRASNNSRTAPEYNAGLIGALAAVKQAPGNWNECLQGNGILSRDTTICDAKS